MNYCDKIHYTILAAQVTGFEQMVEELLAQLPQEEAILRLSFFGMPKNNEEYVVQRNLLRDKIKLHFEAKMPAFSYVAQLSLGTELYMEVHSYTPGKTDKLNYQCIEDISYVTLENECGSFLYAGGFQGDVLYSGISEQAVEAFNKMGRLLHKEGFSIDSIIRQWNYIERITAYDQDNQHYQAFNNARSDFYRQIEWVNGYPAATGIGTNSGGILIDLDAAIFASEDYYATPIDNKLQIAAHAYSEQVLEIADHKKSTPKFERAKSMTFGNQKLIYISGTAAIRGEESLDNIGLERQLYITMENIAQLTEGASLKMLRVYLKDPVFYEQAKQLLDNYSLGIPIAYLWADVCRDELLIEIEGIALM